MHNMQIIRQINPLPSMFTTPKSPTKRGTVLTVRALLARLAHDEPDIIIPPENFSCPRVNLTTKLSTTKNKGILFGHIRQEKPLSLGAFGKLFPQVNFYFCIYYL